MATIHTFDAASIAKLREDHDKLERQVRQLVYRISRQAHAHVAQGKLRAVRFRNDHTSAVPRRGVMKVTGAVRYLGKALRTITRPDTTFQSRYLVNLESRVAAGGQGWGTWLEDDGEVLYDSASGTPVAGEEWGVKSGQWSLARHRPGFWILGGNDTTAKLTTAAQWYVTELIGQADADIGLGGSGQFNLWAGASGSEAEIELTVTVRAKYAPLTAGKGAVAGKRNGIWYASPWECAT